MGAPTGPVVGMCLHTDRVVRDCECGTAHCGSVAHGDSDCEVRTKCGGPMSPCLLRSGHRGRCVAADECPACDRSSWSPVPQEHICRAVA